jgi:hypothetical protein
MVSLSSAARQTFTTPTMTSLKHNAAQGLMRQHPARTW